MYSHFCGNRSNLLVLHKSKFKRKHPIFTCRMLSALSLALALAPAAIAHETGRHHSHFPRGKLAPQNNGFKTKHTKHSSSVKCKAVATTYNFQSSQDAHAAAGVQPSQERVAQLTGWQF
jgi:hypothetical protein